uniref:Uncharacterized protein n=1 Tax=Lygus hesperus TaxID=30085 RepID=A0A146LNW1_LYGHE
MACQEEAVRSITVAPVPPLTALYQVFSCSCLGNLCCLFSHSFIEVEVLMQSSRGVVLSDTKALYEVFRERYISLLKTEVAAGILHNGVTTEADLTRVTTLFGAASPKDPLANKSARFCN